MLTFYLILLLYVVKIFMIGFFCKIGRYQRNYHYNNAGPNTTFYNIPVIAFLEQVKEKKINSIQRTSHHITNRCGSSSPEISSKLFGTHGYKYGPESCTETQ